MRDDYDDELYSGESEGMEEAGAFRQENPTLAWIKSFLGKYAWLFIIIIVLGGYGIYKLHKKSVAEQFQKYMTALKEHKAEFKRKDAEVRMIEDLNSYITQRRALMDWYFQGLEKIHQDFKGHPEFYDTDAIIKEARENLKRSLHRKQLNPNFEKAFTFTKEIFLMLKEGKYSITASDVKEGMRLDFYRLSRQNVDGKEKLKADFFLWGVFGDRKYGTISIQILNENRNMFATLHGSGAPYLIQEKPEAKVREFPPGMVFGFYAFDLLTPMASFITLRFDYEAVSPTGIWTSWTYEVAEIPVEKSWCVAEHEIWDKAMEAVLEEEWKESGLTKEEFYKERYKAAMEEADRVAEEVKRQEKEHQKELLRKERKKKKKKRKTYHTYPGYE